jgi:hypothetical protein
MPDGNDWLSSLASKVSSVGSYIGGVIQGTFAPDLSTFDITRAPTGALNAERAAAGAVGNALSVASDKDPSKLLTGPIMAGLHDAGIGAQGDEWDKGLIGLLGTGFSKAGSLLTYGALATTQNSAGDDPAFMKQGLNKKAWDMAFSKENPIDFGAAIMADQSVLTDPSGLKDLHKALDSTWYGNMVAGAITYGGYALADPTKGGGKLTAASRAANYVADPMHADRLATALNNADAAGTALPTGNLGNTARALVGKPLDDASQVGRIQASMAQRFGNDTNFNSVLNKLDPTHGEGTDAARMAAPVMAELIADAGKITDPTLRATAQTNIFLASANGPLAMKWLADNLPMAAAKLRRTSMAPSEFTLVRNVMDDVEANGIQSLDMNKWVDAHYTDPAQQAELKAYASKVEDVRKFKQTIEHGGPGGAEVSFRTSAAPGTNEGTMVVPRALEQLKAGLNQHVLDEHLLKDGASGLNIRIVNSVVTPNAPGSIHMADPIMGNKQLMGTMRQFSQKMRGTDGVDAFTPAYIEATSESYLRATPAERGAIVDNVNDALLQKVAEHYSAQAVAHRGAELTPENVRQLVATANAAKNGGRAYAEAAVKKAQAAGESETHLGDLTGADTVLKTAHMASQLETTRFLWDWRSASDAVDSFYKANRITSANALDRVATQAGANSYQWIAGYHKIWKHAVLLRPGLAVRALEDTGLRASVTIGAQNMAMQALTGALNVARNHGNGLLNTFDSARMTMTAADKEGARRAQASINMMTAAGEDQAFKIMDRTMQANRSAELAGDFATKIHNMPTPRPAKPTMGGNLESGVPGVTFDPMGQGRVSKAGQWHTLSNFYADAELRAVELEQRQRGSLLPSSGGKPLGVGRKAPRKADGTIDRTAAKRSDTPVYDQPTGLRGLNAEFAAQAPVRKAAIKGYETAKARYEQGHANKFSNAAQEFDVNGYKFALVKSNMDYDVVKAEAQGGGTASDMYLGQMSQDLKRMRVDANHGSDHVAPDDAHWAEKHAATANVLRSSPTARKLLMEREALTVPERTDEAVVQSYLTDPKVVAEYRGLSLPRDVEGQTVEGKVGKVRTMVRGEHLGDEGMKSWLSQLNDSVRSMTPTQAAYDLLVGAKDVTPEMSNAAIRGGARFPIFGPDVFRDVGPSLIEKFYKYTLNVPDVYLARVPMVNGLYRANVRELVPRYIDRATSEGRTVLSDKELEQIHQLGMQGALNDTRRDMYDVHRNVGIHGVAGMISPFFAPWEDAMTSWGRLMYDNPAVAGKLMRYSQIGDMFHVTTDSNGKPTQAWDGTGMQDKYINIPLHGIGGLESLRANVGSFNSIQQGNVPFSPGVGPLVQLGSTALVGWGLTKMGGPGAWLWKQINEHPDNIVNKTFLPQGGVPKADWNSLIGSPLPSYMRKLSDAIFGDSPLSFGNVYSNAFGTRYGNLITQFRTDNGGRDPSKVELVAMQGQADSGARAAALASASMSFGIGISGNAAPEGQLYVDKMHALNAMTPALAAQGLTPGGVFATMYPNASRLNWSFSVNDGHLQATVNATSNYYKNRTLMDANPDSAWWIAGADNILANLGDPDQAGKTFSQSAYNQQMTAGLRRRYNKTELIQQQDIAMGYGQKANFDSAMALYMRDNGIKSLSSKNAGQLGVLKNEFIAQLGQQFPAWEVDQSTMDRNRRERQITQIQGMVENPPPTLRDRPDVATTAKYLFARQALADNAKLQGVTAWQTSAGQLANRYSLWQYGQSLAAGDIVFQQAWSRLFESEFKNDLTPTTGA